MSYIKCFLFCIYCAALPPPPLPHGILPWLLMNQLWQTGIQKLDNDHTTHAHAHEKVFVQMRVKYDISPTSLKSSKNRPILGRCPFPSPRFGGKSFHLQRPKFSNLTPSTQACSSMVGLINWVKQGENWLTKSNYNRLLSTSLFWSFWVDIDHSLPDPTWTCITILIFSSSSGPRGKKQNEPFGVATTVESPVHFPLFRNISWDQLTKRSSSSLRNPCLFCL